MLLTLFGLILACATLLVYFWQGDRLATDTYGRRQLDAWALACAALGALLIVSGSRAALRQETRPSPEASLQRVEPVERLRRPKLEQPAPDSILPDEPKPVLLAQAASAGVAEPMQSEAPLPDSPSSLDDGRRETEDDPKIDAGDAEPSELAPQVEHEAAEDDVVPEPIGAPDPEPVRIIIVPPTATPLARVLPSPVLPPLWTPAPTPHCGDPDAIDISLRLRSARIEWDGDRQVVHYRARVNSDSGFPVNLTSVTVSAQDSRSGSDSFGSKRLPDLRLDAGRSTDIEGSLRLERNPSPMSRLEFCLSLVSDTCGQSGDFPLARRCIGIDGF